MNDAPHTVSVVDKHFNSMICHYAGDCGLSMYSLYNATDSNLTLKHNTNMMKVIIKHLLDFLFKLYSIHCNPSIDFYPQDNKVLFDLHNFLKFQTGKTKDKSRVTIDNKPDLITFTNILSSMNELFTDSIKEGVNSDVTTRKRAKLTVRKVVTNV